MADGTLCLLTLKTSIALSTYVSASGQSMHRAADDAATDGKEKRWKDAECCDVAKSTLTATAARDGGREHASWLLILRRSSRRRGAVGPTCRCRGAVGHRSPHHRILRQMISSSRPRARSSDQLSVSVAP